MNKQIRTAQKQFLEHHFPGNSQAVKQLRKEIARLCNPDVRKLVPFVFLGGEIGAGKTYLADVIGACAAITAGRQSVYTDPANGGYKPALYHGKGEDRKYSKVTLPGRNEEILQSEIFGHVEGAFTGAVGNKPGAFMKSWQEDMQGVVFLDEIGHASMDVQYKLLQLLSDRSYSPMGSNDTIFTECLIITATNKNLDQLVRKGNFLPDLHSRIQGSRIHVPPLRDNRDQIRTMLDHIWDQMEHKFYGVKLGPESKKTLLKEKKKFAANPDRETMGEISKSDRKWAIEEHEWPHNLRQLKSALEAFVGSVGKSFQQCVKETAPSERTQVDSYNNIVNSELNAALREGATIAKNPTEYAKTKYYAILKEANEWYVRHNDMERSTIFSEEIKKMNNTVATSRNYYRGK